jgi:hypothetical protein
MAILAIHRQPPNWPDDPARPIFEMEHEGEARTLYVETDGDAPTADDVEAFLNPPAPVPTITKRQALLFLLQLGKTDADVEAAIDAIADPVAREGARIEWRYPAGPLHHEHPLFSALAPAIGLKVEDLPAAFEQAAKL